MSEVVVLIEKNELFSIRRHMRYRNVSFHSQEEFSIRCGEKEEIFADGRDAVAAR